VNDTDRHALLDPTAEALATVRATCTPAVAEKLDLMAKSARFYEARGSAVDAAIAPGFEALVELVRVVCQ
jgi:hypothetical protein